MPVTRGKPRIEGSVLRADSMKRPAAREPDHQRARGFPSGGPCVHCSPLGPEPRYVRTTSVISSVPDRIRTRPSGKARTIGCPTRREAVTTARARFNSGLTP